MNDTNESGLQPDRFRFASMCAWAAIAASIVSIVTILIADFTVQSNDMIADTISAMAAGPEMWLAEIGIYAFAFALMATALGAAAGHPGGWSWSIATVGFVVLGVTVFLIGFRDEYGDGDFDPAETVHIELVYTLAATAAVTTFLASRGTKPIHEKYGTILLTLAIAWTIMAPVFVFLPTAYDGLYERFLALILVAIVATMSMVLRQTSERP